MKNGKILVARALFAIIACGIGGVLQVALWKTADMSFFDALAWHPYLWIIYFLIAHLITEQCLRLINHR